MPVAVSSLRVCRPVATKSILAVPDVALRYCSSASLRAAERQRRCGSRPCASGPPPCGPASPFRGEPDWRPPLAGEPALKKLLAPADEFIVGTGSAEKAAGIDAIDLDYLVSDRPEKCSIVRGDQVAERSSTQQPLQPDDAWQVEMIGRLVEQQQIGLADKFAGQSQPLRQPPERVAISWSGSEKPTCVSVMAVRVSRSWSSIGSSARAAQERTHGLSGQERRHPPGRGNRGERCVAGSEFRRQTLHGPPGVSGALSCRSRLGRSSRCARRRGDRGRGRRRAAEARKTWSGFERSTTRSCLGQRQTEGFSSDFLTAFGKNGDWLRVFEVPVPIFPNALTTTRIVLAFSTEHLGNMPLPVICLLS